MTTATTAPETTEKSADGGDLLFGAEGGTLAVLQSTI